MSKHDDNIATSDEKSKEAYEYDTRASPLHVDAGDFQDRTISVRDWVSTTFTDIPGQLLYYVKSLFPIATWIYRYNLTWFTGDVSFSSLEEHKFKDPLLNFSRLLLVLLLELSLFHSQ